MNAAYDSSASQAGAVPQAVELASEKKSQYYALFYREMHERQRAEESLQRSNALLHALSAAQLQFVAHSDLQSVFAGLLASLLGMTGSGCGLIAEFVPSSAETTVGGLQARVLARTDCAVWPAEVGSTANITTGFDALIARLLAEPGPPGPVTGPVTSAEKAGDGDAAGPLLGLPFVVGGAMVGLLALNAAGATDDLAAFLQPALATCGQIILANRSELRRQEVEHALAQERASLAQRVEERTAELQMVNAELGRAMHAKDEFLATINHELRSPLNAIVLCTETLAYQLDGPLSERQLRSVQNISVSAGHLLGLINEMLDVAKMESGKLTIDLKPCQVKDVCQASLRLIAPVAETNRITLSCSIDNIWEIEADERRLTQILVNLLSNAVKFTPSGGAVGLEVRGDVDTETVHFTVWDTGIGIAKEDMRKLFRPFSQVDNSRAHRQAGTGLGLALVYRLAELHGGGVAVASAPDQGSRFTVSLPRHHPWPLSRTEPEPEPVARMVGENGGAGDAMAAAAADGKPAASEAAADELLPAILVADDNQASLEALAGYLKLYPCQVVLAHDGKEAVAAARQHHPRLVLMDLQMPEMDGLQAMRQIHAAAELAGTPVVMMTALVTPVDRERCLAAGASDFLSKPIDLRRLQQVLQETPGCSLPPLQPVPSGATGGMKGK